MPSAFHSIHTLVFKDIKINDSCLIEMKKFISNNKWKGVRYTTKGIHSLELVNNTLNLDALTIFCEAF